MTPDPNTTSPRAWQLMLSGRRLDIVNPSPVDIEITDIAHGLARVARWNGQTLGNHAFSVAQHSLLVEQIGRLLNPNLHKKWQLALLLHDAPEFVIGDMITPVKAAIGKNFRKIEDGLQRTIHIRFSLPATLPVKIAKLIKRSDRIAAYYEAVNIAGFDPVEAEKVIGKPRAFKFESNLDFQPWSTKKAQTQFQSRFKQLESSPLQK